MGKTPLTINDYAFWTIEETKSLSKAYEEKPIAKPNWSTVIALLLELAEKHAPELPPKAAFCSVR